MDVRLGSRWREEGRSVLLEVTQSDIDGIGLLLALGLLAPALALIPAVLGPPLVLR